MWGADLSTKPGDKITVPEYVRCQVGDYAGQERRILATVYAECPSGLLGLCHYLARDPKHWGAMCGIMLSIPVAEHLSEEKRMSKSPIDTIEPPSTVLDPPELSEEQLQKLFKEDPFWPERQHTHDCEECTFLGSANLPPSEQDVSGPVDFYYCDKATYRTYICRYGSGGHEYTSYPGFVLRTLRPLARDITVLQREQKIQDAAVKSSQFKLGLWVDPDDPSKIEIVVSALVTLRYQESIRALMPKIWERFGHDNLDRHKLDQVMCYIEQALSSWCEDPSSYFPVC